MTTVHIGAIVIGEPHTVSIIKTSLLRQSGLLVGIGMLVVTVLWGGAAGTSLAQASGCWSEEPNMDLGYPQWSTPPRMVIDASRTYVATIETNRGNIVVELATEEAPTTVNNFVCLAQAGYYDVTVFHRIMTGFMVQGGDPTGSGAGGPGYQINDELPTGDAPYTQGTIAMANSGANTNGSQFFVVHQDQPAEFPPNYSIFGVVTEGLEVLDTIAAVPVGPNAQGTEMSRPQVTLGIKTITILEDGAPMADSSREDVAAAQSPVASTPTTPADETAVLPATEVGDVAESESDDDSSLALWIAGGAVVVVAAGYGGYRVARRTAA